MLTNMKMDRSNPFMEKGLDKSFREEILADQASEFLRVVPFITFGFYIPLTSDGFIMPGPDEEGDLWAESLCFEIKPMAIALRVMIRPDVAKADAIRILNKIIQQIGEDESDWSNDLNKFIADLKAEGKDAA